MGLTSTSRATAWRELPDLVAKGCLVPTGKGGRSSAYEIPWAELALEGDPAFAADRIDPL